MSVLSGQPEEIVLHEIPNLNARAVMLIAAPGGGKTEALAEFFRARDLGVLAIDPAGQLGNRVSARDDVEVWDVPADWRALPDLWTHLRERMRRRARVVLVTRDAPYKDAPEIADAAVETVKRIPNLLVMAEEAQRIVPQNQAVGYSYGFRAEFEMGRNDGHGRLAATQRIASIDKEVFARGDLYLLGRLLDDTDAEAVERRLRRRIADPRELEETVNAMLDLAAGEFVPVEPKNPPTVNGGGR